MCQCSTHPADGKKSRATTTAATAARHTAANSSISLASDNVSTGLSSKTRGVSEVLASYLPETSNKLHENFQVGIIGGGIAGSTLAIELGRHGISTVLLEQKQSLVSGPPMCHLHAGGYLYREISTEQCIHLLEESIKAARYYPYAIDCRPTVIAVPKSDGGSPTQLEPRLEVIKSRYAELVKQDPKNKVLGKPEEYYQWFSREQVEALRDLAHPVTPKTLEEWMIPVAKGCDLNQLQFPILIVQEYGWGQFRLSAAAHLALHNSPSVSVQCETSVQRVKSMSDGNWQLQLNGGRTAIVDFLVNAAGHNSGWVDDEVKVWAPRYVELKAAYCTKWPEQLGVWPEVIFHGKRGTPDGMAQFTPYPGNLVQVHGMTEHITLFREGLAKNDKTTAQAALPDELKQLLHGGFDAKFLKERTRASIEHMAKYVPAFKSAEVGGPALFGAQQVPGNDPGFRAAQVVLYADTSYARIEIVKASSAIGAAEKLTAHLCKVYGMQNLPGGDAAHIPVNEVTELAQHLAAARGYPSGLARQLNPNVKC